jgi:hypothetical protein
MSERVVLDALDVIAVKGGHELRHVEQSGARPPGGVPVRQDGRVLRGCAALESGLLVERRHQFGRVGCDAVATPGVAARQDLVVGRVREERRHGRHLGLVGTDGQAERWSRRELESEAERGSQERGSGGCGWVEVFRVSWSSPFSPFFQNLHFRGGDFQNALHQESHENDATRSREGT